MAYSTYIENGPRPDNFDRFGWFLEDARVLKKPVFVVALESEQVESLQKVADAYAKRVGVHRLIVLGNTLDVIVSGDLAIAQEIAAELHVETNQKVAIVPDSGKESLSAYVEVRFAIHVAKKHFEPWHVYDSKTESVEATLDAALKSVLSRR